MGDEGRGRSPRGASFRFFPRLVPRHPVPFPAFLSAVAGSARRRPCAPAARRAPQLPPRPGGGEAAASGSGRAGGPGCWLMGRRRVLAAPWEGRGPGNVRRRAVESRGGRPAHPGACRSVTVAGGRGGQAQQHQLMTRIRQHQPRTRVPRRRRVSDALMGRRCRCIELQLQVQVLSHDLAIGIPRSDSPRHGWSLDPRPRCRRCMFCSFCESAYI